MALKLVFDVYGTLIDTQGVLQQLQNLIGNHAKEFSATWRNKQLEYSFRRGLMQKYCDFSICTQQALEFTCEYYDTSLTDAQKLSLLNAYSELPAFRDVKAALLQLKSAHYTLCAFSNGKTDAVIKLLKNADIYESFDYVISVDDVQSFKPSPKVYAHLLKTIDTTVSNLWLISSNSFDVIGAKSAGLRAAWVQRIATDQFDPWEYQPDLTVSSLTELARYMSRNQFD